MTAALLYFTNPKFSHILLQVYHLVTKYHLATILLSGPEVVTISDSYCTVSGFELEKKRQCNVTFLTTGGGGLWLGGGGGAGGGGGDLGILEAIPK